ncbi:hypothetical protein ACOMHN_064314 [Nucella lapillus]
MPPQSQATPHACSPPAQNTLCPVADRGRLLPSRTEHAPSSGRQRKTASLPHRTRSVQWQTEEDCFPPAQNTLRLVSDRGRLLPSRTEHAHRTRSVWCQTEEDCYPPAQNTLRLVSYRGRLLPSRTEHAPSSGRQRKTATLPHRTRSVWCQTE